MSPQRKIDLSAGIRAFALLGSAVTGALGLTEVSLAFVALAGAADTYKFALRF